MKLRDVSIAILLACSTSLHASATRDQLRTAANHPEWHRLLHMQKGLWGRETSSVTAPDFFLAPHGQADPFAELKADLEGFSKPDPTDPNEAARCEFPARFAWLDQQGLVAADVPRGACPRFDSWREKLEPKSVSLVFASYYFNNPASMYGHTFFTLNRGSTSDPTHTLDYTVNYAAITNSRSGLAFAVKGLAGGYMGRFSTDPYYIKIQQYTNLESRDLWEYELNLSQASLDRLMKHLWELGPAAMPYFFLNRNCSFQLLPLLEVADPALNLSRPFVFRAIPIDTLRAVLNIKGAVKQRQFRPAHRTRMLARRDQLSPTERKVAYDLALQAWGPAISALNPMDPARKYEVLNTAYDLWRFRSGFRRPLPDRATQREKLLLTALNALPENPPGTQTETPEPAAPEVAHPTGRVGVEMGTDRRGRFVLFDTRAALHDLLNSSAGYPVGNELSMFQLRGRINSENSRLSLDKFTLIEIKSFPAYDSWVRPPSWRLRMGLEVAKDLDKPAGSAGIANVDGGSGLTFAIDSAQRARWYSLWEAGAQTGPTLRTGYRVGLGVRSGVAWQIAQQWRANVSAAFRRYGWGDVSSVNTLEFEQAVSLTPTWEWRLRAQRDNHAHELASGFYWYF